MKILVVGPSPVRTKGGMATVIKEIGNDSQLAEEFSIDIFESYIDGGKITRAIFCIIAFLRFYFTKRNYDVYHIHAASRGSTFRKGWYVKACKKWEKKVIFHIHGAEYMVFYEALSESRKEKMLKILKSSDMVIALSEEWKKTFDQAFGLKNCCVLENGIDMAALSAAVTDPHTNQNYLCMLGKMGKRKGTYDLIDAMEIAAKKNPELKIFLAGDGEVDKVRHLIEEKKLSNQVEVVGWVNQPQKVELLKKTATVVLPSYNEGLPMAILEGMACGKAIISTNVGAIPEVVHAENGIVIEPGNIPALADAILTCTGDSSLLQQMGTANRNLIERRYSMRYMHDKLAGYYNQVMKR